MNLPNDPTMLLSVINMKLRDDYASLDDLCRKLDLDRDELCQKLKAAGYEYAEQYNRFW